MTPFPNISRIGLTFHNWPLTLTFDLPQQTFDVSATLEWRLTLTLDWRCRKVVIGSFLDVGFGRDQSDQNPTWFQRFYNVVCLLGLTWIFKIGIMYSSRTIYLPRLKFLGKAFLSLSCRRCERPTWSLTLTLLPTDLNIDRAHLLTMGFLPTNFEGFWGKFKVFLSYQLDKVL